MTACLTNEQIWGPPKRFGATTWLRAVWLPIALGVAAFVVLALVMAASSDSQAAVLSLLIGYFALLAVLAAVGGWRLVSSANRGAIAAACAGAVVVFGVHVVIRVSLLLLQSEAPSAQALVPLTVVGSSIRASGGFLWGWVGGALARRKLRRAT